MASLATRELTEICNREQRDGNAGPRKLVVIHTRPFACQAGERLFAARRRWQYRYETAAAREQAERMRKMRESPPVRERRGHDDRLVSLRVTHGELCPLAEIALHRPPPPGLKNLTMPPPPLTASRSF